MANCKVCNFYVNFNILPDNTYFVYMFNSMIYLILTPSFQQYHKWLSILYFPDKSGCSPESSVELARHIIDECPGLEFSGIMTIGALARSVQQEETNEDFDVGLLMSL